MKLWSYSIVPYLEPVRPNHPAREGLIEEEMLVDGLQRAKQSLSLGLSILLVFTLGPGVGTSSAFQSTAPTPTGSSTTYPGQGVPETADELQSLVAPIALYPDALVAQILNAATFPDQVAVAEYWLEQNKTLTGKALVIKGSFDPAA